MIGVFVGGAFALFDLLDLGLALEAEFLLLCTGGRASPESWLRLLGVTRGGGAADPTTGTSLLDGLRLPPAESCEASCEKRGGGGGGA